VFPGCLERAHTRRPAAAHVTQLRVVDDTNKHNKMHCFFMGLDTIRSYVQADPPSKGHVAFGELSIRSPTRDITVHALTEVTRFSSTTVSWLLPSLCPFSSKSQPASCMLGSSGCTQYLPQANGCQDLVHGLLRVCQLICTSHGHIYSHTPPHPPTPLKSPYRTSAGAMAFASARLTSHGALHHFFSHCRPSWSSF